MNTPLTPETAAPAPKFVIVGFKVVPWLVCDSRFPLSVIARAVFTYYCFCGLLDSGVCQPKQSTVAQAVGISIRTLYKANLELATLGIIRVVHPMPQHRDGRLCGMPSRIIFLPMHSLSVTESRETTALTEALA